jgi:hypothetical protein
MALFLLCLLVMNSLIFIACFREGALLAYGNPLLDISVNDDSLKEILKK